MEKQFNFKLVEKDGILRKTLKVNVELGGDDTDQPRFSASGSIPRVTAGQILDRVTDHYNFLNKKDGEKFNVIRSLWEKYHLNDMNAGTLKQEEALIVEFGNTHANDFMTHCEYLKSIGLYEDEGYKYGSGWLYRAIPEDDLNVIKALITSTSRQISESMVEYMQRQGVSVNHENTDTI